MNRITVKAYGKLNLGLAILGRDERGYHNLQMVMQSVGVYDLLTITEEGQGMRLTCDDSKVPTDETNLVLRCARALLKEAGRPQSGLTFHLEKHLPMEAGMAGGSADGAAALVGLNELLKLGLSQARLLEIGVKLGADIPFCLTGGTQLVEGIGEKLTPLSDYTAGAFLIGKPIAGVSTKAAFAAYDALEEKPLWQEEFARLLEAYQLPEKKLIKDMSKGMRMKFRLATALAHKPRLLILDEATSGLDPVVRGEVLDYLRDYIQDENHSVLMSSHITSDLEKVADSIAYLHKGKLLFQMDRDELLEKYGVLRCSPEQLEALDSRIKVATRKTGFTCETLVSDVAAARRALPDAVIDRASIEDIMQFYTGRDAQ